MAEEGEQARDRVSRVFKFLQAFHQLRNPVPRAVTESAWYLWLDAVPQTQHSWADEIGEVQPDSKEHPDDDPGLILRARRPRLTECPVPPPVLEGWLQDGWRNPEATVRVTESTVVPGTDEVELFPSSAARVEALGKWKVSREAWSRTETPARRADRLFQELYALHGKLQRESERYELVLGDGNLVWKRQDGDTQHPVVLQSVHLEFDPDRPEFRVVESDREVELYSSLLGCFEEVDAKRISACGDELVKTGVHPLLAAATDGFLRRLAATMSAKGTVVAGSEKPQATDFPQFYRRPVLFLRPRAAGFSRVIEKILGDLEGGADLPLSLERIVGDPDGRAERIADEARASLDDGDVLLSKEANPEQVNIVQRLHDHGSVLVQGPPGTGKSHTIGNLIGHLLAHGQSVLVTSHTTKALNVLRGHVVEDLRPLCVSVLDSDVESRRQLEEAVTNIADRLSRLDRSRLTAQAHELDVERARLRKQLGEARTALRDARLDEQRPVIFAGTETSPRDAAHVVRDATGKDDWIPGPVVLGGPLPLSASEITELYGSNAVLDRSDEALVSEPLPDVGRLASPAAFDALVAALEAPLDPPDEPRWWTNTPDETALDLLESAAARASECVSDGALGSYWQVRAILAGMAANGAEQSWAILADQIEAVQKLDASTSELLLRYDVRLPTGYVPEEVERLATEVASYVEAHGAVGFVAKLQRRDWAKFLRGVQVAGTPPKTLEHYAALKATASLQGARAQLQRRWERLIEAHQGPSWSALGLRPELGCSQYAEQIRRLLRWKESRLDPVAAELKRLGLRWDELLDAQPPRNGESADLDLLVTTLKDVVPKLVRARQLAALHSRRIAERTDLMRALASGPAAGARLQRTLASAVETSDQALYRATYEKAVEVSSLVQAATRRRELLERLQSVAPAWAECIRSRTKRHGEPVPPGDAEAGWRWLQLHSELERRAAKSLPELQKKVELLTRQLREVTVKLIDRKAWVSQLGRTTLRQQQALVGWLDLVRRIGKGTGKRAPILRAQAVQQMRECRTAVPVWIMPLARVAEMFDDGAKFDVVIIDEASQCDVMGLVAVYMGKRVVVVGDHEQVSPSAVGQQIDRVGRLIDQHLTGIPNSALYDGKTSIYDLARQSFGGLICLTEHFRCYPDIIEFSNWLSYQGKIRPLREPASAALAPFVVPHRVPAAERSRDTNPVEAAHTAALVVACTEQKEYASRTFGVVSLLGDDQATEVEKLLREHLPESEYARRKILCGNAAQFQGDERDVMFLSVVYSPNPAGGPLSLVTEAMYQQRFNVASSRARDQMWVVYSLDPTLDLKPGDLRRKLIEHAVDPRSRARQLEQKAPQTESDFERRVLERLVAKGFRVTPQHPVGAYRIDLVVEGSRDRLAVECDGERFHTPERLDEDMARQAILERLGWKFVRIRGSLFYRDPDRAMKPVFDRLAELRIEPEDHSQAASQSATSDLHRRVLARAMALLGEWGCSPTQDESVAGVEPESHGQERSVAAGPPQGHVKVRLPHDAEVIRIAERRTLSRRASDRREPVDGVPLALPFASEMVATATPMKAPQVAEVEVPSPTPSPTRRDVLMQALARHVPEGARCPICGAPVALRLSTYGPFRPCSKHGCTGKLTVEWEQLKQAVKAANIKCSCGGEVVLKRGRTSFLGCSKYPACTQAIWWRDL